MQHQSRIFCATRKCNTEIYHFCNQKFQHFLQQKSFVAKNVKISDCKNGGLPCCTSVLHKMSDFGVAQNLNFVVALVIAAHKFLLVLPKFERKNKQWLIITQTSAIPIVSKMLRLLYTVLELMSFFTKRPYLNYVITISKNFEPPPRCRSSSMLS